MKLNIPPLFKFRPWAYRGREDQAAIIRDPCRPVGQIVGERRLSWRPEGFVRLLEGEEQGPGVKEE